MRKPLNRHPPESLLSCDSTATKGVFHRNSDRQPVPPHLRGGVVAIGNFDGIHRGHRSVLDCALTIGKRKNLPVLVLTFEPHPRTVFRPNTPVMRLTPAPLRARILNILGFDAVAEHPFDQDFSQLSPEAFILSTLVEWLGACEVVTGFDFHFGRGREGTPDFLIEMGKRHRFNVTLVKAFRDQGNEVVSSSRIRSLLRLGNVSDASDLLGYHFTVDLNLAGDVRIDPARAMNSFRLRAPGLELGPGTYGVRFRFPNGIFGDGSLHLPAPNFQKTCEPQACLNLSAARIGRSCTVSFLNSLGQPESSERELLSNLASTLLRASTPLSDIDRELCFDQSKPLSLRM